MNETQNPLDPASDTSTSSDSTAHPAPAVDQDATVDDALWASALAEQAAQPAQGESDPIAKPAAAEIFQPLLDHATWAENGLDRILDIPVELSVELGRTRMTLKEVLQLGQGSVVELDGLAGEPMDIYINNYLIAQGEVVVVDEQYGIRITDIITPSDRLARLNQRR